MNEPPLRLSFSVAGLPKQLQCRKQRGSCETQKIQHTGNVQECLNAALTVQNATVQLQNAMEPAHKVAGQILPDSRTSPARVKPEPTVPLRLLSMSWQRIVYGKHHVSRADYVPKANFVRDFLSKIEVDKFKTGILCETSFSLVTCDCFALGTLLLTTVTRDC